jgi:hypothetical protein
MAMSFADTLSIVAIVVSMGTLLATLYEQYWKRPQLSLVLGDSAFISHLPKLEGLVFWACVVLANQGAEDAVILRIEGTLSTDTTWKDNITWEAVGKYQDEAHTGQPLVEPLFTFRPSLIFSDWADALVSSSRKASASWIAFSGERLTTSDSIPPGLYNLQLNVIAGSGQRGPFRTISRSAQNGVACSWTGSFNISDNVANQRKEGYKETPDQPASGTYSVRLQGKRSGLRESPTATLGSANQRI